MKPIYNTQQTTLDGMNADNTSEAYMYASVTIIHFRTKSFVTMVTKFYTAADKYR